MIVYAIKNCNQYVCLDMMHLGINDENLTFNIAEAYFLRDEQEALNYVNYFRSLDKSSYSRYSIVKVEIKEVKDVKG